MVATRYNSLHRCIDHYPTLDNYADRTEKPVSCFVTLFLHNVGQLTVADFIGVTRITQAQYNFVNHEFASADLPKSPRIFLRKTSAQSSKVTRSRNGWTLAEVNSRSWLAQILFLNANLSRPPAHSALRPVRVIWANLNMMIQIVQ